MDKLNLHSLTDYYYFFFTFEPIYLSKEVPTLNLSQNLLRCFNNRNNGIVDKKDIIEFKPISRRSLMAIQDLFKSIEIVFKFENIGIVNVSLGKCVEDRYYGMRIFKKDLLKMLMLCQPSQVKIALLSCPRYKKSVRYMSTFLSILKDNSKYKHNIAKCSF